jgi:peptidoglycan hydrolase-like protein with peptidoglycan-binding domain
VDIDLPVTSQWVRLDELHPRFKLRLGAFFDDPFIKGRVSICSGVRTVAAQQALYDRYKSGKGNLAANPLRSFGNGFQGSWHMCQPAFDDFGFAVDLRITGSGISTWEVTNVAQRFGFRPTVKGEWWHFQPYGRFFDGSWNWFDAPELKGEEVEKVVRHKEVELTKAKHPVSTHSMLMEIAEAIARARRQVLRKGARGDAVKLVQMLLEKQGIGTAKTKVRISEGRGIDGIFGRGTDRAVKEFQRNESLTRDGVVGPATWNELFD